MLTLARLTQVDPADLIGLMNDARVRRHMPLATSGFGAEDCAAWVADKEAMWTERGYGPWAFLVDGVFAGWGGLQPEGDDADLALVLRPAYWGHGRAIAERVLAEAFGPLGLDAVTVLLPPSRGTAAAVRRLGFRPDGTAEVAGLTFHRFRISSPARAGDQPTVSATAAAPDSTGGGIRR
ncbi:GNAT family N-acetyltransferase [Dactylosporangium aurantiacum]|uniref:GNAT family N-acetyltransferase n=1 Tax=Dactylosporangium aurantiacum TaxID=35754 RepID=A0A9Q9I7I3_9ACTN|nr:GNAT family N-acetyltransferase [Dactylosporangium aurantiacum]MDG6108728.1 GNAT family N-acetyltransferase [Dactylosporangium aurantiacum]UWZ51089.1 GNAT family N-acetyltransferase [Dactylosporangium aurantiacum]